MDLCSSKERLLQAFSQLAVVPLLLLASLLSTPSLAVTLNSAYESALRHRASVASARLDEEIADSQHNKAIASVLPSLNVTSDHSLRDPVGGSSTASAFGQRYQHTAALTLTQPIFQGGAEYSALGLAATEKRIAELRRQQAELDLYLEVANSFFSLATYNAEISNLLEQDDLLEKRIVFLQNWVRIGRSKPSELIAVQSQKARVAADLSKAQSEQQAEYEQFLWLTGLQNAAQLETEPVAVTLPTRLEVDRLPSVKATALELENAERQRSIARAEYLPNVDLQGNYYLQRAGILAQSKWDMNLTLTWNLFSGGSTAAESSIRAKEILKKEIELRDLKHRLQQEFLGLKRQFEFQKRTVQKLEMAVKYAQQNYNELQEEFKRGLITNLDVLRAMDDHLTVKRALDREKIATKLASARINTLLGIKP